MDKSMLRQLFLKACEEIQADSDYRKWSDTRLFII
jgi:hypothetical protein